MLRVLLMLCRCVAQGKQILHRQPTRFYLEVLGRDVPKMLARGIIDDSSLLDMSALTDKQRTKARRVHDFWSAPSRDVAGALEDEEEGEPEELFHDVAANVPVHTSIDKSAGHWWGPFRFDHVRRVITRGKKRGSVEMQWQVTCFHHHDAGDPEATKCRTTKGYEGQDESRTVCRQLRQWCLDGRRCISRKT